MTAADGTAPKTPPVRLWPTDLRNNNDLLAALDWGRAELSLSNSEKNTIGSEEERQNHVKCWSDDDSD